MKHTFAHFDIPADDVERAKRFYTELFGWKFTSPPEFEGYWLIQTGDEGDLGGGLMKRQAPGQGPVNYVQVESVAEYLAKLEGLGGQVTVPKTPVPGMGWFAHFVDPEGIPCALWETDVSAA